MHQCVCMLLQYTSVSQMNNDIDQSAGNMNKERNITRIKPQAQHKDTELEEVHVIR